MPPEAESLLERVRSASGDELQALVHDSSGEALLAVLENPHCEELHVTLLLERLELPANVIDAVAAHPKWMSSEGVRLRLAAHPRTSKRIALATLRQLYLFDLVRLSFLPSAPANIRRAAEEILLARVPSLPVGQKLTLARRGPSRVAAAILAEGHAQVIKPALNNPFLTESQILKVLAKAGVLERVVAAIAQHSKWAGQYHVRRALLRNSHTPVPCVLAFLPQFKLHDVREIARLQDLAPRLRKYVEQELARRSQSEPPAEP
jgi:hypothetical protein